MTVRDFARAINILHLYFVGKPEDTYELQRKEFFARKCCSYNRNDLNRHFQEMNQLFYILGADVQLKHVFLNSVPLDLAKTVKKAFQNKKLRPMDATLAELHQELLLALEELCMRRQAFRTYLRRTIE